MITRDYGQQFIQFEKFAPTMCSTEKAHVNKFILGLRLALKDRVVNQKLQTLAQAMEFACQSKEVLNEQFGPLKKDNDKITISGINNNKNATNQQQATQKNGQNSNSNTQKTKKKDNQQGKLICPIWHVLKQAGMLVNDRKIT